MDIEKVLQEMHAASDTEKERILKEVKTNFENLSDVDKEKVRKIFLSSLDDQFKKADELFQRIDMALEIEEVSKYISLSKIAKDYFGKSKEWLYQRIKGYNINGKPAKFTPEERKKLADALQEISRIAHETSLKIA